MFLPYIEDTENGKPHTALFVALTEVGKTHLGLDLLERERESTLTLPIPSLLVPIVIPRGEGGSGRPLCYLENHCLQEHEILYGIKEIFEHPKNVSFLYFSPKGQYSNGYQSHKRKGNNLKLF